MRRLFKNARLILHPWVGSGSDSGAAPEMGELCEQGGVIQEIRLYSSDSRSMQRLHQDESSCNQVIDCEGDYLAPGLIDLHCHGAVGRDTMEATADAFDQILQYHLKRGTTLAVLTTVAASLEEMERVLTAARHYKAGQGDESILAGIHLEGPYFSPERRGAHRAEMLRQPDAEEIAALLRYAEVIVRMTLAPELPGALDLVRELLRHGITVSAGHSDATAAEAERGFASGITQVTHLYNCMSSLHSKRGRKEVGLAEVALSSSGILCEVIADSIHLPPRLLRLAWLAKGWREIAIVSDATAGAGLRNGETFSLGGLPCRIEHGAAWTGEGDEQRLAGSTISMIDGVRVMVEKAGIPIEEAVAMASLVPARALGLGEKRGSLEVGKQADLVRLSEDWEIQGVWKQGKRI